MKYSSVITAIALLAVCSAPVYAASSLADEAVKLAARDSKAGLDAICLATYKAVKAEPEKADVIFESVLGQRADWKASEVYAILRSVLLARPDLTEEICSLVKVHRTANQGKNGGNGVGAVGETSTISPMLARIINVLYDAALPAGVAEEAFNMTVATLAGTYAHAYQSAFEHIGGNTNMEGPSLDTMLEFIPTLDDMSGN